MTAIAIFWGVSLLLFAMVSRDLVQVLRRIATTLEEGEARTEAAEKFQNDLLRSQQKVLQVLQARQDVYLAEWKAHKAFCEARAAQQTESIQ